MADSTNAERQRRHRRHKVGDHSLCDPKWCAGASAVTVKTVVTQPAECQLGRRGARLWREEGGDKLTGGGRMLLEEACRTVDRLDRLDAILAGEPGEWMRFRLSEDGTEVAVIIDKALAEARQQAIALKQIIAELRQSTGVEKPATGGSVIDQLAARRADRLANAAGQHVPAGIQ